MAADGKVGFPSPMTSGGAYAAYAPLCAKLAGILWRDRAMA